TDWQRFCVWDPDTEQWSIHDWEDPLGGVESFAVSPDGSTLIAAGLDGQVQIREIADRSGRSAFRTHDSQGVESVAISPDGRTFATSGADNTVRLWSLATGLEIFTMDQPPGTIRNLAFSPDGRHLAGYTSNGLVLWLAP